MTFSPMLRTPCNRPCGGGGEVHDVLDTAVVPLFAVDDQSRITSWFCIRMYPITTRDWSEVFESIEGLRSMRIWRGDELIEGV